MTATKLVSLKDFWNATEVASLFVVSTAIPAGEEFTVGGEDCDVWEVLDSGLSPTDLWEIEGEIDADGDWNWNGVGNVRDFRGNSYTRISLIAEEKAAKAE